MSWRKAFPSKWLRGEDLGAKKPFVVIDHVAYADVGGDQKLVMYFVDNSEKPLILNATHCGVLDELFHSDDETKWTGARLQLYAVDVEVKGQHRIGARFLPAAPVAKTEARQKPGPRAKPATSPVVDDLATDDDEVPF